MADRGADLAAAGRRAELTVLACHIPVKVTVVGRPSDDKLLRLADSVESAVAGRLAEAGRVLPAGIPVLHPPGAVQFSGDLTDTDRGRLDEVLRAAVVRAIRRTAQAPPPRPAGARPQVRPLAGQPFAAPFLPADFARGPAGAPQGPDAVGRDLGQVAVSPSGEVRDGASPFDGSPVAALPGRRQVFLQSPRYAMAGTLTLALQLGMVLFADTSFALLEGPEGRFWTVGTEPAVDAVDLAVGPVPDGVILPGASAGGRAYRIRGLITRDRRPAWRDRDSGAEWLRQLAAEAAAGVPPLLPDHARAAVVAAADQLVAKVVAAGAAELPPPAGSRPTPLDREVFALVPWEAKAGYLRVLLAGTPWAEQQRTALEIFASLADGAEVDAVAALLRETGLHGRLFDDPDREVYDLFAGIGERFPLEPGRLTVTALATLLRHFDLLPGRLQDEALIDVTTGPTGTMVPEEVLDEAYDSVTGLILAGNSIGESVSALFTSPQLVARARESLADLLVKVRLAALGYRPAIRELDRFLERVPSRVLAPARGGERLGVGGRTLRRLEWREIWEIASLSGPGGVLAAPETAALSGDAAGVLRFLDALARLGQPVDAGTLTARVVMLTGALVAEHPSLGGISEAAALLSCLPDSELRRLGVLVAATKIPPGTTLDGLAVLSAELHAAATDALAAASALRTLASGSLDAQVVAAFHMLLGAEGVGLAGIAAVAAALPEGQGPRFAAALRQVPLERVGPCVRTGFLELLAGETRRMDALSRYGFDAYAAVYRRVSGEAGPLDRSLNALAELAGGTGAAGFRRLLDDLARDDPAAWRRVGG